jgi:hypothetical protein
MLKRHCPPKPGNPVATSHLSADARPQRAPSLPASYPAFSPETTMRISKWHPGKLIILWSWGALLAAVALTSYFASPVAASPRLHLCELLLAILILATLSCITWRWLSGRELDI